jgi:hypothetical protein
MARLRSADHPTAEKFARLLADAETAGLDLELADLPEALGELERVKIRLTVRALSVGSPPDALLKVGPASEMLGIVPETLYRRADQYPFTVRDGGNLRFSRAGIQQFIRSRQGSLNR